MRRTFLVITLILVAAIDADAKGCRLWELPSSLLDGYLEARIVAVGRFQNAVPPNNALPDGQIEMILDDVVLPHAIVKGRKSVTLSIYREIGKEKFLVALDINKGEIEAVEGRPVDAKGEIVRYVRGALQLKDKSKIGRGLYAANFLYSPNEEIARSARTEISRMPYADSRKLDGKMQPEPLLKVLLDPEKKTYHPVFGMLLGHCGKKEHAAILRKLLDEQTPMGWPGSYGAYLHAYVLMEPEAGWKYAVSLLEQKEKPFLVRYAALQTIRFVAEERKDIADMKKCTEALTRGFESADMVDFVIEDLRKWKRWELCDMILEIPHMPGFDTKIIRRAVLRYALKCPTAPAKVFVQIERTADPERVAEIEELLALEYLDNTPPMKK